MFVEGVYFSIGEGEYEPLCLVQNLDGHGLSFFIDIFIMFLGFDVSVRQPAFFAWDNIDFFFGHHDPDIFYFLLFPTVVDSEISFKIMGGLSGLRLIASAEKAHTKKKAAIIMETAYFFMICPPSFLSGFIPNEKSYSPENL